MNDKRMTLDVKKEVKKQMKRSEFQQESTP